MTSFNPREEVRRHVARSGVDLPDATIDELVAYLEDLHSNAVEDGDQLVFTPTLSRMARARLKRANERWRRSRNPHSRCCSAMPRSIPIDSRQRAPIMRRALPAEGA